VLGREAEAEGVGSSAAVSGEGEILVGAAACEPVRPEDPPPATRLRRPLPEIPIAKQRRETIAIRTGRLAFEVNHRLRRSGIRSAAYPNPNLGSQRNPGPLTHAPLTFYLVVSGARRRSLLPCANL
jgi:hypothetical protein